MMKEMRVEILKELLLKRKSDLNTNLDGDPELRVNASKSKEHLVK